MPRKPKQTVETVEAPPGVMMVRNRLEQTWVEPRPVEDETQEDFDGLPEQQTETHAEISADPSDKITNLISEFGEHSGIVLQVERLPEFKLNGMAHNRAVKEFICEFPLVADWKRVIQTQIGAGDFLITAFNNQRKIVRRDSFHVGVPTISVNGSNQTVLQSNQVVQTPPNPVQAISAQAPTKEAIQTLSDLVKFQELLEKLKGGQVPPQQTKSVELVLAEYMIQNPAMFREKMAALMNPTATGEPGNVEPMPWWAAKIDLLLDKIAPIALAYLSGQFQPGNTIPQPAANPEIQFQNQLPENPMPQENVSTLVEFLLASFQAEMPAEEVAPKVVDFVRENSLAGEVVKFYLRNPKKIENLISENFDDIPDWCPQWVENVSTIAKQQLGI